MQMIDKEKVIKGLKELHGSIETMNLISDAIALVTEQEPKVLTLEEVEERMNTNDAYDSIFYAEVRTLTKTSFGVFQLNFDSEDYYVAMLLGSSFPAWYRKESYGKKWRCWSTKPTIKQRQEVKWE